MKLTAENPRCGACAGCVPVTAARSLPPGVVMKLVASYASLCALLLPGAGFALGLLLVPKIGKFAALGSLRTFPWELWTIAITGCVATLAGFADWGFHRWVARCKIGRAERRCELIALACGGAPVFALMVGASISTTPHHFLLPVLAGALGTTAVICYDEFVFHARRCRRLETLFHRVLVFGNGVAFLAWTHWCFVRNLSPE